MDTDRAPRPGSAGSDSAAPRAGEVLPRRRGWVLAAVMATIFMAAIESTIVATAMPSIVPRLGGFHLYGWVFVVFVLCQAVTTPIFGKLADLYGRQRILLAGTTLFLVASLLCGFAATMPQLIAFRALQGLGAGAILPVATTIVGDIYGPRERARKQGYLASMWGIASVAGPAMGALIVEQFDWRLVFWLNLPLGVVAMAMLILFHRERLARERHQVDYLGAVLLMLSTGALMLLLVQGSRFPVVVVGGLLATAFGGGAWLFVQERRAAEPVLPLDLWRDRIVASATSGAALIGALMMAVITYLPVHIQGVMGAPPAAVALATAAISFGWALCAALGGRLMAYTSYRLIVILGGSALVAGNAALALLDPADGPLLAYVGALLVGIGLGFTHSTFIIAVQTSVAWNRRGIATSSVHFTRLLGQAFGAAIFGALINAALFRVAPEAQSVVDTIVDPVARHLLDPAALAPLVQALAGSLRQVYLIACALSIAVLVLAFRIPPRASVLG